MKLTSFFTKGANIRRAIVAGAVITCYTFWPSLPARAQLRVAPLFQEEQAERGRAQGVITLSNVTDEPVRVRLYSQPFTYDLEGFEVLSEDAMDLSPFLQFSPREVVIPPREEQRIRVLSLLPPSLPDGEYRAVIFAEELFDESEQEQEQEEVAVQVRIGATFYVRNGEVLPALVGTSAQIDLEQSVIDLLVSNQGEATTRAVIGWQLMQAGEVIAEGEGSPQTVIAQGDRIFSLALPEEFDSGVLASGDYTLTGELYWMNEGQRYVQPFELPVSAL